MDVHETALPASPMVAMDRLIRLQRELLVANEELREVLESSEHACRATVDELYARGLDLLRRHERLSVAMRESTRRGRSVTGE